jgi:hypothetical protein
VLGAPRDVAVVADPCWRVVEVGVTPADVGVHVVANHVLVQPQHAVAQVEVREVEQVVHPGDGGECEVGSVMEGVRPLHPHEEGPAEQGPVLAAHPTVPREDGQDHHHCYFSPACGRCLHGLLEGALAPLHLSFEVAINERQDLNIEGVLLGSDPVEVLLAVLVFTTQERLVVGNGVLVCDLLFGDEFDQFLWCGESVVGLEDASAVPALGQG